MLLCLVLFLAKSTIIYALLGSSIGTNSRLSSRQSFDFLADESRQCRLERGLTDVRVLEKLYGLGEKDVKLILKASSSGFLGTFFHLESLIPNYNKVFQNTVRDFKQKNENYFDQYSIAEYNDPHTPSLTSLYENIGVSMNVTAFVKEFIDLFLIQLENQKVSTRELGATKLMNEIIMNGNDIAIISPLERDDTLDILDHCYSILPVMSKHQVPENRLITVDTVSNLHEFFESPQNVLAQLMLRGCHLMKKIPNLVISITKHLSTNTLSRTLGMSSVAIRAKHLENHHYRSANWITESINDIHLEELYKV